MLMEVICWATWGFLWGVSDCGGGGILVELVIVPP